MNLDLSEKIRKCRRDAGFTQVTLAGALGVHANTVRKWEAGERIPTATKLAELANITGVSAMWLLGVDDEPNGENSAKSVKKGAKKAKSAKAESIDINTDNDNDVNIDTGAECECGAVNAGDLVSAIARATFPTIFAPVLIAGVSRDDFIDAVNTAADEFAERVLK